VRGKSRELCFPGFCSIDREYFQSQNSPGRFKKDDPGKPTRFLIKKIILFGSVAKGLEMENSDIDLFVLVKNLEVKKEVETIIEGLSIKCFDLYGNRLAPYVLTEHEMKQRESLSVLKEISQGIEIFPASRGSDVT
jgi:predicted nucleotidyltransferase